MNLNPKMSETLNKVVELLKSGDAPAAVIIATFPPFDVPSNSRSRTNRIVMVLNGTSDARGFTMWNETNRYVN